MEGIATPRITCAYLNSYVGKNVIVVGKVVQIRGDEALIDADGNVTAHLNRVSSPFASSLSVGFLASPSSHPCETARNAANKDELRARKQGTEAVTAGHVRCPGSLNMDESRRKFPN
jgi:hypothetical protein